MVRYIYCSRNFETAQRLADFILPNGKNWAILVHDGNVQNITDRDILIRWGCYGNSALDSQFDKIINTSEALQMASNKYKALCRAIDTGVRVPGLWTSDRSRIPRWELPVLRRKFHHTRGLDIRFCATRRDLYRKPRGDYYSKFIRGQDEFRIHMFDGKIIRASKKVPLIRGANKIIKNSRNGWGFDEVGIGTVPNLSDLQSQCFDSMNSVGLTYGAIDVIYEDSTRLPYVLEINSAPRLNLFGRKAFRRAVKAYMRGREIAAMDLGENQNRRTTRDAQRLREFLRPNLRNSELVPIFHDDPAQQDNIELDEEP